VGILDGTHRGKKPAAANTAVTTPSPRAVPTPTSRDSDSTVRHEDRVLEKVNLEAWKRSGAPSLWVKAHNGQWNHEDWLGLLSELQHSKFWPMLPHEVGQALEDLKVSTRVEDVAAQIRKGPYRHHRAVTGRHPTATLLKWVLVLACAWPAWGVGANCESDLVPLYQTPVHQAIMFWIGFVLSLFVFSLFGLGIAEILVLHWVRKIEERLKLRVLVKQVSRIVARGYVTSRKEYLLLFPGACLTCCSRAFNFVVERIAGEVREDGDGHAYAPDPYWIVRRTCVRCGASESRTENPGSSREWFWNTRTGRVKSLLGDSDEFPDFDCRQQVVAKELGATQ